MRDGSTRQVPRAESIDPDFAAFQGRWQASVVFLSGERSGEEFVLDAPSTTLGRGASAAIRCDDPSMSSEHAALEFFGDGIRLRDLGSMNGTLLNGSETRAAELKNGDKFRLGASEFEFVLQACEKKPKTYEIPSA